MIQSIPNQKLMWSIESDESRLVLEPTGDSLVQQRAYLERARLPLSEYVHQTIERAAGIHDVLDQKDVLPLQLSFRIIHQPYRPARHHSVSVTGRDQEIDLQRPRYLSDEITQEDETSLQQTKHEQLAIGISGTDLSAELGDTLSDRCLIEGYTLDCPSRKPWIGDFLDRFEGAAHDIPVLAGERQRRSSMWSRRMTISTPPDS